MSGWDTPSRPTWDPQEGPEDSTQAFSASDASGADDPWSPPGGPGWGGPADGDDFGNPAEPNGFRSDQNGLPRRGGPPPAPPADFFGQEFEQRQPGATLGGRQVPGAPMPGTQMPGAPVSGTQGPGSDRYPSGPQVSARDEPPWPGPARQESPRQESARPEFVRPGEYGYGREELGRPDLDRPGTPGAPGAQGVQDFPRREPGRAAYSTYSGQPDQAEQAPPPANRADADLAARMDPALQDFFAPTKPDPRYSGGRPSQAAQPRALPGPAQSGPNRFDQGPPPSRFDQGPPNRFDQGPPPTRASNGHGPRRDGRKADPWDDPTGGIPSAGPRDRRQPPVSRGGRHDDELEPAGRGKMFLALGAVGVIVVAVVAYLALHGSGGSNPGASGASTPTTSASAAAPTASAPAKSTAAAKTPAVTGSAASTGAYVLSAPATAAGYPIGTDPHFLSIATSTVAAFEQSGVAKGGGSVTGSPVSASYTLPDAQTIEFVGYQGTFNPTKVMANLASAGSTETTYPAGSNGGDLACFNTTATASTPSGAVCFWVTKSTFGFTEFFTQASGPEALNSAQSKGAEDTVDLRASVEKPKS